MKMSPYFWQLGDSYRSEIEDLRYDSDNHDVLKSRLADKRRAFKSLLPLMTDAPEMVAATFHGSVMVKDAPAIAALLPSSPGTLPPWNTVSAYVTIEPAVVPLIAMALAAEGGDEFLVTMACLQLLATMGNDEAPAAAAEESSENEEEDEEYAKGEDWLSEQGFDRRSE